MRAYLFLLIFILASTANSQALEELRPKLDRPITYNEGVPKAKAITFKLSAAVTDSGTAVLVASISCNELFFEQIGGVETARFRANFHVVGSKGLPSGYLESDGIATLTASDLLDIRTCRPVSIEKRLLLPKGRYKVKASVSNLYMFDRATKTVSLHVK